MIRLEEDEKVILVVRKHWFMFLSDILSVVFLLLLPLVLFGILFYADQYFPIPGNIVFLVLFCSSIICWFLWMSLFVIWTDYYLDILIITNKHVIDVDQKGLFSRELSTFKLNKIQDVTTEVNGLIPTFLKFGTVHIQTAGEDRDFLIRGVPKPFDVRHIISQQQNLDEDKRREVTLSDASIDKIQKA